MAKRKTVKQSEPSPRPHLRVPKEQARARLQSQIEKGEELHIRQIAEPAALKQARVEYNRWDDYNFDLLRNLFTTDEYAVNYQFGDGMASVFGHRTFHQELEEFRKDIETHINRIQSIQDRLDVIPEDPSLSNSIPASQQSQIKRSNEVFVVHGHDELAKQTVARFIEKLGLKAIILHEQPNQGKTIIEKFESFSGVGFAVILLTPDDVGTTKAAHTQGKGPNDRARQNVIFEHGFFVGMLGRGHVCAVVKGEVENPSDLQGVVYIPLDEPGVWQYRLASEMRASGLPVDLNKLA